METPISPIDKATLTPIVRSALGKDTAEVVDWQCRSVHNALMGQTEGVYRITGAGRDRGEGVPWSAILKILRLGSADMFGDPGEPSSLNYWKREHLAYQSGLLASLPGGLTAPRYLGSVEQTDGTIWLWLEDLTLTCHRRWSVSRDGLAARHLGQFNGAYLVDRPLPDLPWLSRGEVGMFYAGQTYERTRSEYAQYPSVKDHPLVRRAWPGNVAERSLRLWAEREAFLEALNRLPRTLCHVDAFRRNLFGRRRRDGEEETVAVDWAWMGVAPLGEEMVEMVVGNYWHWDAELSELADLDRTVMEGYLAGLEDAGWRGDPRLARFGYATSSALTFGLFNMGMRMLDLGYRLGREKALGHSAEEILDHWAVVTRFLLDLADEARALLPTIS